MTARQGERRLSGETALSQPGGSRQAHSTKKTQRDRVRDALLEGWTCGSLFLRWCIPRYPSRMYELRKLGFGIWRRPCESHGHDGPMYEWRIWAVPVREPGEPCAACGGIAGHVWDCLGRDADAGRLPLGGVE